MTEITTTDTPTSLAKLTRTSCPVPPMLEEAIGYDGPARFVAFYWTPSGDEVCYDDGRCTMTGANWHAYQTYTGHYTVRHHLEGYHLGSSEEECVHMLCLDRSERVLYVGSILDVRRVLSDQHPKPPAAPPERHMTASEFVAFAQEWAESRPMPTMTEVNASMMAARARTTALSTWLRQDGPTPGRQP